MPGSERIKALSSLDCSANDLGGIFFATTRETAVTISEEETLFWSETIRCTRLGLTSNLTSGLSKERHYWSELLEKCGFATVKPEILCAFSLALRLAYRVFKEPARFDPWAMALINRFIDRLMRRDDNELLDCAHRKLTESRANLTSGVETSEHESAQLALKATIDIILEKGPEAATYREIAKRAELSMSSVQHFFPSRAGISQCSLP